MSDTPTLWLARYQPWRRIAEPGFWVLVLALQLLFNSLTTWIDLRTSPYWEPLLWEATSNLMVGLLIPALIAFERRFPLRWDRLRAHLPWHVAGTIVFCALHLIGMMALRELVYAALERPYDRGSWLTVFSYEYLKDVRSYVLILAAVLSYRLLLLRLQGEARVLDAPDPPATGTSETAPPSITSATAESATRPERFLVRKLRKEFLILATDIESLQAQGNYVGLRVHGHDYLLRSTLNDFLERLDPAKFVRVHRSHAVNLDRIAEIEPTDGGDARLKMKDGSTVPCSRRYREVLRAG
ncbi:LytTR family transcriptional regulator [Hylemonella gracilis str. Niagara R]|uniref:LytTR family transcriptional regulator n=1 Tax=Hylemonella gracilis str. Niagara R TaxID=1458275 RepID=A0A016XD86_9BURK|nr:LytTR family DNA-binding domain-containing protein [Hylemonella gracilis]EYC49801.1 LytTR family transcriptional regulator [Hylemonella gracilis str. Niagara R]